MMKKGEKTQRMDFYHVKNSLPLSQPSHRYPTTAADESFLPSEMRSYYDVKRFPDKHHFQHLAFF